MEHQSRLQKIIMAVLLVIAMAVIGVIIAKSVAEKKSSEAIAVQDKSEEESGEPQEPFSGLYSENAGITIVIDAGHGGDDPGKVGVNGEKEKDINLVIAHLVSAQLEQYGIQTIMTRKEDAGLSNGSDSNTKVADLKNRLAIFEENEPVLGVSIHQNSYRDAAVCGPQVFYYATSAQGEKAATIIQNSLNEMLSVQRPRVQKGNTTYYILKKTHIPLVIVECGFLSNPQEAALLSSEEYQIKVAKSITKGILDYIEEWKKEAEVFLFIS